ncbi:hypothetical protein HYDPIDRAFT_119863 [Hydnomerulius pinastri MD-312]|uniref:3-oxoacyl-[acyl-carrier-protein] reductase n=1 Tax=Hydnomerulius pinastri MD-312 TaxID=994086 RepID=A0A0C9W694_9AGAM|nr:hypothetical protein HYDPIDRAFT_119863 [Hydnomerulius pinastri MD-312]
MGHFHVLWECPPQMRAVQSNSTSSTISVDSAPKGVALVTGSGRGIGRSIALRLASDGYDLGLNDTPKNKGNLDEISAEIASEYPGRRVCVLLADVSVQDEVKALVEGVVKQLGQLDVVSLSPFVRSTDQNTTIMSMVDGGQRRHR